MSEFVNLAIYESRLTHEGWAVIYGEQIPFTCQGQLQADMLHLNWDNNHWKMENLPK